MRIFPYALTVAIAITPVGAPSIAETPQAEQGERTICRNVQLTGTRFPKRTCRTQAAWREIEQKSRESFSEMRDRPKINCVAPGGNAC